MRARAECFGAATIVNALAIGKGAAYGIRMRAEAEADLSDGPGPLRIDVHPEDAGDGLVRACIGRMSGMLKKSLAGWVATRSTIPPSRGLKSSSATANATVLAAARSLGVSLGDFEAVNLGVDAALDAGVTITGAFDDACATYFGGVVVTDNRRRVVLMRNRLPTNLVAVVAVPIEKIEKRSLRDVDFSPIAGEVTEAFDHAMAGDYGPAIETNSRAYCRLLGIDPMPATKARRAGAIAAGLTGTGPAFVALCRPAGADAVADAMSSDTMRARLVSLNTTITPEAFP